MLARSCLQQAKNLPRQLTRSYIIPTKKTNVVNVFKTTPRMMPKGSSAVKEAEQDLVKEYDPTGAKTKFMQRDGVPGESVKTGDVVRVTRKDGSSFTGMALAINRHNINSTILLRTKVQGTAVEMLYNVFNPDITNLEVARKAPKTKHKAKLYYLRGNVKYDVGDLDAEIRKSERRRK